MKQKQEESRSVMTISSNGEIVDWFECGGSRQTKMKNARERFQSHKELKARTICIVPADEFDYNTPKQQQS